MSKYSAINQQVVILKRTTFIHFRPSYFKCLLPNQFLFLSATVKFVWHGSHRFKPVLQHQKIWVHTKTVYKWIHHIIIIGTMMSMDTTRAAADV